MTLTAEEILKMHVGNMMVQIASLQAALESVTKENEALKAAVATKADVDAEK